MPKIIPQNLKGEKLQFILKGYRERFFVSISFLIVFILLFSSSLCAFKVIQLDKPKIRLIIPPGQSKTGRIEVKNPSPESREIKIYIEDWVYADDTGSKNFMPSGTADLSCANWIDFVPAEFTVPAFGEQYINYTVRVPPDAKGGHYAVIFFESRMGKPEATADAMAVVPVAIRVGSLLYVEPAGTIKRAAQIENLSLSRESKDSPLEIKVDFKNIGNVDITAAGNFNIIDKAGIVYGRGEFNTVYTFPSDVTKLTATWKGPIPKGKYDLIITIDLGKALEELGMGRGPAIVREAEIEIGENQEVERVGELK